MKTLGTIAIFLFFAHILTAQDTTNQATLDQLKGAFGQAGDVVQPDTAQETSNVQDSLKIDIKPLYVTVNNDRLKVKGHKRNGVVSLKSYVNSNPDDFSKYLSDKIKSTYNAKVKRRKGKLMVKEAAILEISNRPVNMWADVEIQGDQSYINAAFELNDHYYIQPKDNPDEFEKCRTFVHFLVKGYYIDFYTKLLDEMQQQYDDVVSQKEDLLKERKFINSKIVQYTNKQANNLKRIAKNEALIEKEQGKIEMNEAEIDMNEQLIKELEGDITKINQNKGNSSEELAAALDKVGDKQKDIQKARKSIEKAEKQIARAEAVINKAKTKNEDDRHENTHYDELIAQEEKDLAQKDVEIEEMDKVIAQKQAFLTKITLKLKNIY